MSAHKPVVQLSRQAERDFDDIVLFTRRTWGEQQKRAYRAAIGRALRQLRDFPELGPSRDDLFPGCRGLQVEQHVLYYHQPRPTTIVVVRILHVRQEPVGNVMS